MSHRNFKDDAEVAELVRGFEACEIHPAELSIISTWPSRFGTFRICLMTKPARN